jgi:hypothetical protein
MTRVMVMLMVVMELIPSSPSSAVLDAGNGAGFDGDIVASFMQDLAEELFTSLVKVRLGRYKGGAVSDE